MRAQRKYLLTALAICSAVLGRIPHMTSLSDAEPANGDRERGEYLSSECVTCHPATGRADGIPPIVGWPEARFIELMKEYQRKNRPNPVMQMIAGRLSEEDIAALAVYFGSQKSSR
jgi:cytochrome c